MKGSIPRRKNGLDRMILSNSISHEIPLIEVALDKQECGIGDVLSWRVRYSFNSSTAVGQVLLQLIHRNKKFLLCIPIHHVPARDTGRKVIRHRSQDGLLSTAIPNDERHDNHAHKEPCEYQKGKTNEVKTM